MKNMLIKIYNKITDRTKCFRFMSVKAFCELEENKYKTLACEQECEELRPCIWKVRDKSEKVQHILPETYIAEIKGATVFGENELVISKGMVLSDIFTSRYADRMYLTKRIVKSVDLENKTVIMNYHNYRKLPLKQAIDLVGIFSYNYYHFVINILPKLYYLYQCDEYIEYPLLMDQRAYQNFKVVIDAYNVYNRKIICIGSDVAFRVEKLVVLSNCAWYDKYVLENYFEDIGHVYDKMAIQFVRNHALKAIKATNEVKRVWVSRKHVEKERKRLEREEEVEALFQKYGFISVCPEKLSFLEQVELFSQVEVFAGATGAAFTNIIFLPENATIIYATCVCGNTGENLFPSLWNTVGSGKFIILQGKVTESTKNLKDNMRKFELNIEEIEELLRTLG